MPELALPGGNAQQWGTAPTAWLCLAGLTVGLSPRAHIALGEPRQTQIPNPRPGASLFRKELPAESVLAAGRMAPTRLSKILLASTVEHPPWDPHPMGNSTGACQPLVMVHNAVLGNNQEE